MAAPTPSDARGRDAPRPCEVQPRRAARQRYPSVHQVRRCCLTEVFRIQYWRERRRADLQIATSEVRALLLRRVETSALPAVLCDPELRSLIATLLAPGETVLDFVLESVRRTAAWRSTPDALLAQSRGKLIAEAGHRLAGWPQYMKSSPREPHEEPAGNIRIIGRLSTWVRGAVQSFYKHGHFPNSPTADRVPFIPLYTYSEN
jgi:hypothetical protein